MKRSQYGMIAVIVFSLILAVVVFYLAYPSTEVESNNDGEYSENVTPTESVSDGEDDLIIMDDIPPTVDPGEVKVDDEPSVTPDAPTGVKVPTEAASGLDSADDVSPTPTPIVQQAKEYKFASRYLLDQHYEKHGIEMGFASAEEYELAASAVVNNPDALHKLEAEDNDDVYYVEETNEFVVVSTAGYIRTYFNPSSGKKYFDRQ